jgi:hypothetical protein
VSARGAAVERVLSALRERGGRIDERGLDTWMAQCPADGHDDRTASLSIAQGDIGAVVCCQAGCDTKTAVLPPLKLTFRDLFDPQGKTRGTGPRRVAAEYRYTDERGELLFVKVRYEPKNFSQKRPDGRGGWIWNLGKTRRVLYRLPAVLAAIETGQTVYLVEGEKDADRLAGMGLTATCNFDGAAKEGQRTKWQAEYGDLLRGADVVIIADRDGPGVAHAQTAAADLDGKAKSVAIVQGAVDRKGADVSDHLDAGFSLGELIPMTAESSASQALDEDGSRGPSQAAVLTRLAEEHYRLLRSDDGRPYAVRQAGPSVAILLRGKGALRAQLARIYADAYARRVPSASALADALTVLEGRAIEKDPEPVHLRLARHGEQIVLDLGTSDGRCAVIGPDGWSREPRSPVLFRRTNLTSPIPDPVRDGDGLGKLRNLLNAEEKEFRLIIAWLIAALLPDIPHPIMALRGEQGSAKSSTAQMLVDLIDPSPAPLRSVPRDMKQWAVTASASWAVALDNVSMIPGWLSDTLCKAVTGDGYVDRVLYSDDDVTVLAFRRAVLMTSIDPGALAGDLAERLLVIELQPILDTGRRPEAEVREAFAEARPAILASLLGLLAKVLATLPDVSLDRMPRMADFARVLAAVDKVQQWTTLADYRNASTDVAADVLDGNEFAKALIALADAGRWEGTSTALLAAVGTPDPRPREWPKDATRAGGQLKRLATALRTVGIEVVETRSSDRKRARLYAIEKQGDGQPPGSSANLASAASAASATVAEQPELADASADAADPGDRASVRSLIAPDAADASADADRTLASAAGKQADLREQAAADAADAADAEIRELSGNGSPYPDDWPAALPEDWGEWPA